MTKSPAVQHSLRMTALYARGLVATVLVGSQLFLGLGSRVALAQDTTRMASPLLLKRLAEAVDGVRTGSVLYVVATYDHPNAVVGVFENRRDAERLAQSSGSRYDVFGPYRSIRDLRIAPQFVICQHVKSNLIQYCPLLRVPLSDVESVTMTVRLRTGQVRTETLTSDADAVFFTLAALDKFAFPYYSRTVGIDETMRMRQGIVQSLQSR